MVVVRVRRTAAPVPAGLRLPGPGGGDGARPPKAIGKGLFTNAFLAMLFTERYVRPEHELAGGGAGPAGRGRRGGHAGRGLRAGRGAARSAGGRDHARSRGSWHLHADETTWRVFAPREGDGPARWWLWVFLGPDTACFVMDATRSGAVLARHAASTRTPGSSRRTRTPSRGGW